MSNGRLINASRFGFALALLAGVSAESQAQNAVGYEVRLLQPGSSTFDALLRKVPSKQPVPQFARSAPLRGALLINDSAHPIVAFTVRWKVTHKDGSVTESYQSSVSEPYSGGDVLSGLKAVLEPAEQAFVTPGVHWTTDLGQVPLLATFPSSAAPGEAVAATLDCAVFSDGTIAGPNKSNLFERISIERRGQIDEADFVARALSEGKPDENIRLMLEGHIQRGRAVASATKRDWYLAARGRQALRMAVMLENGGRNSLQSFTTKVEQMRSRFEDRTAKL
jgi:hypothetical protein